MPDIHPSALVSDKAVLADDVSVGPFAIIDAGARIGAGCKIGTQAWITGHAVVGENNDIGYGSIIGGDPQDVSFDTSVSSEVVIGDNNCIREYVTIHRSIYEGKNTMLGNSNFLMTGAHMAHDVQVGNFNNIANNVLLAGHIIMGDRIFLGGGSAFHQFLHIGDYAIVQGNAAISRDVPAFCTVYGNNQLSGLNVIGLRRGGFSAEERSEIKRAYRLLFRSGGNLKEALDAATETEWSCGAEKLLESARSPSRKGLITRV